MFIKGSERPQIKCHIRRNNQFVLVEAFRGEDTNLETAKTDPSTEVSQTDVDKYLPTSNLSTFADEYVLFFWTESAFFTIDQSSIPKVTKDATINDFSAYANEPRPILRDHVGKEAGTVCKMAPQHWESYKNKNGPEEFILVGRRSIPEIPEILPVILAMQIEWIEGVAYRVNMAEIREDAWLEAGPERKLIAMA